jgi:hypothetical protein
MYDERRCQWAPGERLQMGIGERGFTVRAKTEDERQASLVEDIYR